ncbi:hypothetical protein EPA93_36655 [Ktedonosporobacter rubrisoli]|uniref:Uncharacterized protein n=1 Tax=Ktedonosporobacter rubrisoli TaxID=2509675 RepID=A0A4P6K0A1_KTERU|nr:hypothetical protein [Ktedonosporobacter rubrisoli]QBD81213.1 hypothetical protein EPA93_36655 [Ktedonosporobacter rubrisoli]
MLTLHHVLSQVATLVDAGGIKSTLTARLSPITTSMLRQTHVRIATGEMLDKLMFEQFSA